MEKFYRVYAIDFEIGTMNWLTDTREQRITITDTLSISYPLTAEFSIGRSIGSGVNTAIISVYGLHPDKMTMLYKDKYDIEKYIRIKVYAGYGSADTLIFYGSVKECQSFKQSGSTEYRTVIDAYDGGLDFYLSRVSKAFDNKTDIPTMIQTLCSGLPDLTPATLSPYLAYPKPKRGINFTGKTLNELKVYFDGNMVIDNGKIHFLDETTDVLADVGILEISCDTGLLGSPRRRNTMISVDLVFEPRAELCQLALLNSSTLPYLNQTYKIMSVQHNGIISGSKNGAMTTTLDLFLGSGSFKEVKSEIT
jgi:hypothetical protein